MMPPGLAVRLGGVQIWDWSDPDVVQRACELAPLLCDLRLRFDEIYLSYSTSSLLVGEQSHYLYRMLQLALNEECRRAAADHIKKTAERLLGEPWELLDRTAESK